VAIIHVEPAPVPARESIRANLIVARAKARLTQARLADAAGVTRQTISDLERGAVNISIDVLDRIARALNIEVRGLFAPPFTGVVDAGEIARRRAAPRSEFISARAVHSAIREAQGDAAAQAPSGKIRRRVRG
jgi:transcriptional regulator with XRE-family HTH domain